MFPMERSTPTEHHDIQYQGFMTIFHVHLSEYEIHYLSVAFESATRK
jgi:hypothetical protein